MNSESENKNMSYTITHVINNDRELLRIIDELKKEIKYLKYKLGEDDEDI